MRNGRDKKSSAVQELEPLENLQLGARVYQALLNSIVTGQIAPGAPLRPEAIARQLEVSTTPVREAMHRIEGWVGDQTAVSGLVRARVHGAADPRVVRGPGGAGVRQRSISMPADYGRGDRLAAAASGDWGKCPGIQEHG